MSRKQNRIMDALAKRGYVTAEENEEQTPAFGASASNTAPAAAPPREEVRTPAEPAYTPPVYTPPPPVQSRADADQLAAFFGANPVKIPGVGDKMNERSFWDNTPEPTPSPEPDRFMDIEELYRSFGMKTSGTDTVYLVEEYIKTLPESLPAELRRSIILKIVAASGFDFDRLLNDGIDRVSRLNDYSQTFASHTDSHVKASVEEIAVLERQIAQIQDTINERKNLHKRQFLAIENEGQRLKEILDFITK